MLRIKETVGMIPRPQTLSLHEIAQTILCVFRRIGAGIRRSHALVQRLSRIKTIRRSRDGSPIVLQSILSARVPSFLLMIALPVSVSSEEGGGPRRKIASFQTWDRNVPGCLKQGLPFPLSPLHYASV